MITIEAWTQAAVEAVLTSITSITFICPLPNGGGRRMNAMGACQGHQSLELGTDGVSVFITGKAVWRSGAHLECA